LQETLGALDVVITEELREKMELILNNKPVPPAF
jgi:hypothetical protein